MKDHQKVIQEYKKIRYKIPTLIFALLPVVPFFILIIYGEKFFYWQNGLVFLFGATSFMVFAYRHGHEEGYSEGYDTGKKDGQKTVMDEVGFKHDEILLYQLEAAQKAVKKEVKKDKK